MRRATRKSVSTTLKAWPAAGDRVAGGEDGAVKLGADAELYAGLFDGDERAEFNVPAGRRVYVHVARGVISVNGEALVAGDAAKLEGVSKVTLDQGAGAEVILFDLA